VGGGRTAHRSPSAVIPAPKAAAGCRERAGGPGFSCCRTRRRESHPPPVCATSTEAKARAGCISPGAVARPLSAVGCRGRCSHPRKHAVVGRLKDEIPLSASIYTQKYIPWVYIFEPLLNPVPRRGRQPGARGDGQHAHLSTHTATPCTPPTH
jgi:hypothetical protein